MAITYDSSNIASDIATTGNFSLTVADNPNRVLVFIHIGSHGMSLVDFNGDYFTAVDTQVDTSGRDTGIWFLGNPDTGTHNIGWIAGGSGRQIVACVSLYGADTRVWGGTAKDTQTPVDGLDVDIVLQAANSWTVELQGASTNIDFTQTSSQTQRQSAKPDFALSLATKAHTNAGSTNLAFTTSGTTEASQIAIEIVEPGALGAGNFLPLL